LEEEQKAKRRKITQTLQETSKVNKEKKQAKARQVSEEESEDDLLSPEVLQNFVAAEKK
jgi:hypothetical protein